MQTSYESDFVARMFEYGFGLRYDGQKKNKEGKTENGKVEEEKKFFFNKKNLLK